MNSIVNYRLNLLFQIYLLASACHFFSAVSIMRNFSQEIIDINIGGPAESPEFFNDRFILSLAETENFKAHHSFDYCFVAGSVNFGIINVSHKN